MVGSAQYQGGGFSGTGKARVMHFETVSAARGTPSLLAMTTSLFVQNRGLYYYDPNSSTADDGTEDTPAIQSGATAGRYLPSTYAIGADEIEQGNALLAASSIRRSSALPFVTQRATTANPAADMATWTVANRFTWTAAQPDHLGGNAAKLATSIPGANSFSCRGDLTGIVIGDEWEIVGYAKPNGSPWLIVQFSFGSVTFNLLTGKTNGGISGSLDVTQDYVSSSILPAGNGFYKITIRFKAAVNAEYIYAGIGEKTTGALAYTATTESMYFEAWTCTRVNVSAQLDLGTAGSTISQAVAASAPCYEPTGWDVNASGAIRWTGRAQSISDSALPTLLSGDAQPWALVWMLDPWIVPTADAYLMRATSGGAAALSVSLLASRKIRVSRTNSAGTTVYADTVLPIALLPQVLGVRYDGSQFSVFVDGIPVSMTSHASSDGVATFTAGIWGGQYLSILDAEASLTALARSNWQIRLMSRALGYAWDFDTEEPWIGIVAVGQSNAIDGAIAVDDFAGRQRYHAARRWYGGSLATTTIEPFYSINGLPGRSHLFAPDWQLVKNLVAAGKRKLVILKYGIGGTALYSMIPSWLGVPNVFYSNMIASFSTALALLPPSIEIKAMTFVGYEQDTDTDAGTAAAGTNLGVMRAALMASLDLDSLEVVANLLHADYCTYVAVVRGVQVNAAVVAACVPGSHLHCFSPSAFEISTVDHTHYTTLGRNQLGAAQAAILQSFI